MLRALARPDGSRPPGAIVLLSDGTSTDGRDPLPVADEAKRLRIPVYTVALGTAAGMLPNGDRVPPDTATLRAIAQRSGGQAFTAEEAGALSAVYERLGSQVATKREEREVTGAFAGGALLLLLAGGGLSLRWFRRLRLSWRLKRGGFTVRHARRRPSPHGVRRRRRDGPAHARARRSHGMTRVDDDARARGRPPPARPRSYVVDAARRSARPLRARLRGAARAAPAHCTLGRATSGA